MTAPSSEELCVEVERLRQWKAEATEVILGLQDLGKALHLRPGLSITGRAATEAALRLTARAEAAEVKTAALRSRIEELMDGLCECGDESCIESAWLTALRAVLGDRESVR